MTHSKAKDQHTKTAQPDPVSGPVNAAISDADYEQTRLRLGMATNSSSSHAMVALPFDPNSLSPRERLQLTARLDRSDTHRGSGWAAVSQQEKNQMLAGLLRAQAAALWPSAVLEPEQAARVLAGAAAPYRWGNEPLPDWLEAHIAALTDLEVETSMQQWTQGSFDDELKLPRGPGEGPHPGALAALKALLARPEVIPYSPEENSSHPLDRYDSIMQQSQRELDQKAKSPQDPT